MKGSWLQAAWQTRGLTALALWPLSQVFAALAAIDRRLYTSGFRAIHPSALPVVVVGNLSVGGTGKSPLTAWLCQQFETAGLRPGIVSRGHGGSAGDHAHRVQLDDPASLVGDEPLMLARQTRVPVCVCRKRAQAVALLERSGEVDVVLSDDGLQHHAMQRDVEIVVIDAARGLGNGFRLPAGPLRESPARLSTVDHVVYQRPPGTEASPELASFVLQLSQVTALNTGEASSLSRYRGKRVHAVAGIGRPERFFAALRLYGLHVIEHALPDHHPLSIGDVSFDDNHLVLVTSKDAVKLDARDARCAHVHVVPAELVASTALQAMSDCLVERLHSIVLASSTVANRTGEGEHETHAS